MAARLREVEVVVRNGDDDKVWLAEVDETSDVDDLLPELAAALGLEGDPDEYSVSVAGTLAQPRLVVERRAPKRVGTVRRLDTRRA